MCPATPDIGSCKHGKTAIACRDGRRARLGDIVTAVPRRRLRVGVRRDADEEARATNIDAPQHEPDMLERFGLRYLQRRVAGEPEAPPTGGERPRILTAAQQRELRRIERRTIVRAALAGAASGIASGLGTLAATQLSGHLEEGENTTGTLVVYWSVVAAVALVASVVEILFIYYDSLDAVHRLARVAGIRLFGAGKSQQTTIASALARAALELPNPKLKIFRIDPLREASKFRLTLYSLVYKAKVGATNIVLKFLMRRVLARSALRSFIEFVAAPVYGLWNAYVCFKVMHEARVRVMGPSAARELLDAAFAEKSELSTRGKLAALRAVGSTMVKQLDMHPNTVVLLQELVRRIGEPSDDVIDDKDLFVVDLAALPAHEQDVVLEVLRAAVIMDGALSRPEESLLEEAAGACGRPVDLEGTRRLRDAFVAGKHLGVEALAAQPAGAVASG